MAPRRAPHRRSRTVSLALGAAAAALAVAGCTAGPAPGAASSISSGSPSAQAPATAASGSGAAAAAAPVGGACPASTTPAQIGGAATCLAPGQACTKFDRDQYPTYGFLCLPDGTRYVLHRK